MDNHHTTPETETLGDLFRKLRLEKSLDISDVALETRIPPETIRAIEADDYSALPALAFARGFYSLYATMLGLDPKEVLQRFAKESSGDEMDHKMGEADYQVWPEKKIGSIAERPSHTTGSIISFSLLIIVVAAAAISWYAGYNPAKQMSNWLRGFQESPVAETVAISDEQTSPGQQVTEQESVSAQSPPPPTVDPAREEAKYRLVAEFQEAVELLITLDEAAAEQLSLPGGSIKTWQADEQIVLQLPPDAAVRLYLNGIVVPLPPAVDDKIIVSIPEYFQN